MEPKLYPVVSQGCWCFATLMAFIYLNWNVFISEEFWSTELATLWDDSFRLLSIKISFEDDDLEWIFFGSFSLSLADMSPKLFDDLFLSSDESLNFMPKDPIYDLCFFLGLPLIISCNPCKWKVAYLLSSPSTFFKPLIGMPISLYEDWLEKDPTELDLSCFWFTGIY